jgi:hypothetical protein
MTSGPDGAILIESAAQKEARIRAEEQRGDRRDRKMQLRFNAILMVATIVTTGIVAYQNWILIRSLDEMKTQSKAAMISATASQEEAKAAVVQATASLDAVRLAQDANKTADVAIKNALGATRLDQRANLSVVGFKLDKEPVEGGTIKIAALVANVGRTGALNTVNRTSIYMGPNMPAVDWDKIRAGNESVLFPGAQGLSYDSGILAVPVGFAAAYEKRQIRIYFRTLLTYRDMFGDSHRVEVCAFHESGDDLGSFRYCGVGNSVDKKR